MRRFFPKLAVNGWSLKQKASEVDGLIEAVEGLKVALKMVESENSGYKTRIDGLQENMEAMKTDLSDLKKNMNATIKRFIALGLQMPPDDFAIHSIDPDNLFDEADFKEDIPDSEPEPEGDDPE